MVLTVITDIAISTVGLTDELGPMLLNSVGVLAHPVRRNVLSYLTADEVLNRTELSERLAADREVAGDDADRLELMLHHSHLPKLADEQFVDYEPRSGDVVLWKDADRTHSLLESD
ncbi:DUF7344 domain-containing protein [Haloprofundus salinisoli]|uniref:DUF7344 domain-containing protein n=1 Tax=Haloprofundus salinisoli TaxID=2876193 RepID=UPI001CC96FA3|nr:hypothetical protein [Haloprofundus salinisoli]